MKGLYSYILESYGELYHFTNAGNMISILKSDEFILSGDDGYNPKGEYYMSLTRMQFGGTGYPSQLIADDIVKIVVDAEKLAHHYKIVPIDTMKGKSTGFLGNVEAEERLLSNKKTIRGFRSYIKAIFLNAETTSAEDIAEFLRYAPGKVVVCKSTKEFNRAH